jgi:hypothetical protein
MMVTVMMGRRNALCEHTIHVRINENLMNFRHVHKIPLSESEYVLAAWPRYRSWHDKFISLHLHSCPGWAEMLRVCIVTSAAHRQVDHSSTII